MTSDTRPGATVLLLPVKRWPGHLYRFFRALRFTIWRTLGFGIGVFLVVAILVTRYNLNRSLPELRETIAAATGLPVEIDGSLMPLLRWQPTLVLEGLHIGSRAADTVAGRVHLERIEVTTSWADLFTGKTRVHDIRVAGISVDIASHPESGMQTKLQLSGGSGGRPSFDTSALRSLALTDIKIHLPANVEAQAIKGPPLHVDELSFTRPEFGKQTITLNLRSGFREHPLELSGRVGQLEQWLGGEPVQVDLDGKLAWARISANGELGDPLSVRDVDLAVTLDTESAPALGIVGGYEIPEGTPLAVRARLVSDNPYINVEDLRLLVGGIHLQQSGKQ